MVGLMIVPNAVFGRVLLGQPITPRFLRSAARSRSAASRCCWSTKRARRRSAGDVGLGIWLALGAMFAASISNVIQAGETGRQVPLVDADRLVDALGHADRRGGGAGDRRAAGASRPTAQYWLGTAYLAIAGSVVTFPLYYRLIREIGRGPRGLSQRAGGGRGDGAVDAARRLSLVGAGGGGRRAGAGRHAHRAQGEVGLRIAASPSR